MEANEVLKTQHVDDRDLVIASLRETLSAKYRGYTIYRKWISKGKPQPDEYEWCHEDYDGPEDRRCGASMTAIDAVDQIDETEDDQ